MADYSREQLEQHIQCLWLDMYVLTQGEKPEIRTRASPGHQPDLPVIVADIRQAWAKAGLDSLERQVWTCRWFWDLPLEAIGEVYQLAVDEVAAVLDGVTEQLLDYLNGGRRG